MVDPKQVNQNQNQRVVDQREEDQSWVVVVDQKQVIQKRWVVN